MLAVLATPRRIKGSRRHQRRVASRMWLPGQYYDSETGLNYNYLTGKATERGRAGLIAAFAPDAGESSGGISQAKPPAAFSNIAPDSDGYLWIKYDKFRESFCQDLSADEALVMAITQKAPLGSTSADAITAPAWKKKPSWYQISSEDRMINPENQKMMSARMNPRKVITLSASQASLASHPVEVAGLIDEAASSA